MAEIEKILEGLEACINQGFCMDNHCPYEKEENCIDILLKDVYDLLKEQRWIPVSESLPKSVANKVVVYIQHEEYVPYIGYGHYERFNGVEEWYNLETNQPFSRQGYRVTHWMPMPKSPDGEALTLS